MLKNEAYVEGKTSVWWDIDRCPVPVGYDACRVGPCIQSALEKLGCSGPLTITAVGNLKHTPEHVLRGLSSSGIVVKHSPCGGRNISTYIRNWTLDNPPPAKIMFISDSFGVKSVSRSLSWLQARGFNILLACEDTLNQASATCAGWLWKTLLEGETTRRQPLQTGESARFFCTVCVDVKSYECFSCQSLADFTMHLWGKEHGAREFDCTPRDLTIDKDYLKMMAGDDDDDSSSNRIVKELLESLET